MSLQRTLLKASDSPPARADWVVPAVLLHRLDWRLGVLSLLMAAMFLVTGCLSGRLERDGVASPLYVTGFALSLALFGLTRRKLNPQSLMKVALVYEIVVALLIAMIEHGDPHQAGRMGVSWVAVLIVAFPGAVPASPPTALGAALVAATLSPLAYALTRSPGEPTVLHWQCWPLFISNYAACAFAVVPSLLISRLGEEASRAGDVGAYHLEEKLGQGGMGEVWKASHRALSRPAAVKMIPASMFADPASLGEQLLLRFQREARTTASLKSPHTITLFDYGVTEEGTFYYVMELLEGWNLEELVDRFGPVPPARAVPWLCQACLSLGEAHQAGLIHRDIKPPNLLVCRLGLEVDVLKVLDFGLVSAPPQDEEMKLTASFSVCGTPGYMSPEQAGGEPIDLRTDIYALGCVAYWLLTGKMVFRSDKAVDSLVDLYSRTPVPPSQRSPFVVPSELEQIIMDCLAKQPESRPSSALELWQRLQACPLEDRWTRAQAVAWWDEHLPTKT